MSKDDTRPCSKCGGEAKNFCPPDGSTVKIRFHLGKPYNSLADKHCTRPATKRCEKCRANIDWQGGCICPAPAAKPPFTLNPTASILMEEDGEAQAACRELDANIQARPPEPEQGKHTAGKLRTMDGKGLFLLDGIGRSVCRTDTTDYKKLQKGSTDGFVENLEKDSANLLRLKACWNACVNIPDPEAVQEFIEAAEEVEKWAVIAAKANAFGGYFPQIFDDLGNALEKVKGK